MRRQRRPIIVVCLLALVWCQTAMAAQWCSAAAGAEDVSAAPCHGGPEDADAPGDAHCPGGDLVPDLAKLPIFAALPGHDFLADVAPHANPRDSQDLISRPRDGPLLDRLCRLLI